MNEVTDPVIAILPLPFGWHPLIITAWKVVGFIGAFMFAGRWVVQVIASRVAKKPVLPIIFWYMSLIGSLMVLVYFIFGKNDAVGIIQNFPAAGIAAYNIFLELSHRKSSGI